MNQLCESPKNRKKTNPLEYNYYENVKEKHYLGKYKPDKNSIGYKNSKYIPEIETFNYNYNNNNNKPNNVNINNNIGNINFNGNNKINFAIKSTII